MIEFGIFIDPNTIDLFIIIKGLRSLIQRYLHDQSKKERETEKKTTEWTKQKEINKEKIMFYVRSLNDLWR